MKPTTVTPVSKEQQLAIYTNEWNFVLEQLPPEHKFILMQTLNTPSFQLLLDTYVSLRKKHLTDLDITKSDAEFKDKYRSIKLRQELAEGLADFVKTLQLSTTDEE